MERKRVLFLCTGNSCRSQMSEAVVNARLGDRWRAFSGGVDPADRINPHALEALEEVGIEHHGESKHTDHFKGQNFDLVVTLCDDAAEHCPVWLGKGRKQHLSFPDPAKVCGSDEEVHEAFREVLMDIALKIPNLLVEYEKEMT